MTREEFFSELASRPAVKLARRDWSQVAAGFEESESHDTGLAGRLRLGTLDGRLIAVEEASRTHLAVRALASAGAAREFVQARLDAYDRMWDG